MEEKEKGMDKKDFYKYLADLETLSEAQLIIVKNIIEGMLKPEWGKVAPIGVINTHVPPMDNLYFFAVLDKATYSDKLHLP